MAPASRASVTARLVGGLEANLGHETSGPVGFLLPVPQTPTNEDPNIDPLGDLRRDLRNLKGATALIETTAAAWGEGRAAAPAKDFVPSRIGASPPMALVNLRKDSYDSLLAAAGVPSTLFGDSDATGRREAWRQYLHGSLMAVARIVADEIAYKLEVPNVEISFTRLNASDVMGKARAFASMVGKGEAPLIPVAEARALAGLE